MSGLDVDVSDAANVADAMDEVFSGGEEAHILCNIAGITRDGWLTRMDEAAWDEVLDVNLKGTFLTTQVNTHDMR